MVQFLVVDGRVCSRMHLSLSVASRSLGFAASFEKSAFSSLATKFRFIAHTQIEKAIHYVLL